MVWHQSNKTEWDTMCAFLGISKKSLDVCTFWCKYCNYWMKLHFKLPHIIWYINWGTSSTEDTGFSVGELPLLRYSLYKIICNCKPIYFNKLTLISRPQIFLSCKQWVPKWQILNVCTRMWLKMTHVCHFWSLHPVSIKIPIERVIVCANIGITVIVQQEGCFKLTKWTIIFSSMNIRYSLYRSISNQVREASQSPPFHMVTVQQGFQQQPKDEDGHVFPFLQEHSFAWMASFAQCLLLWKNILVCHNLDCPCGGPFSLQQVNLGKNNIHISLRSTLTTYQEATVSTTLISKTTPIDKAKFPKMVICNKYKLRQVVKFKFRWRHL